VCEVMSGFISSPKECGAPITNDAQNSISQGEMISHEIFAPKLNSCKNPEQTEDDSEEMKTVGTRGQAAHVIYNDVMSNELKNAKKSHAKSEEQRQHWPHGIKPCTKQMERDCVLF
jgi:hypothetical protein